MAEMVVITPCGTLRMMRGDANGLYSKGSYYWLRSDTYQMSGPFPSRRPAWTALLDGKVDWTDVPVLVTPTEGSR